MSGVSSKPPGDEGAQARKYPVDNSRVIEISAYAPRAKRQYRGKRFDQRGKLSSHGCRERRVHIAEAAATGSISALAFGESLSAWRSTIT